MATHILTFADGRDNVELVADMYREDPAFIEFVAVPPAINLVLSPATPLSCAVQVSSFNVDDIAGARGVHRSSTAEDIESFGGPKTTALRRLLGGVHGRFDRLRGGVEGNPRICV